ncbi:NAD(P)-dependent oxidoreductase [Paracoccus sp. (in: a-proteobacteria)]|uniref:NAD(P)-dependent oxidoreductase n=1 Tax=Paracoccus sp. TaxID=267 RepID=UPI00272B89AD|nr:NAD(P)-dependent oxidoreductase [Paracoccus sp. (in: a-proteobacteria)]
MAQVGLIGLGHMGHGIARNLLIKGHRLVFLDHPGNRPVDEILSLGGRPALSPAAVAGGADAVILCVNGSPQVEAVMTGPTGILSSLSRGATIIDCSTSLPSSTLRMAALAHEAGAHFLDAPMTRTAQAAHEGRLNLLVGGDVQVLASVRPVLDAFAEAVAHVGPVGAGHRMKLLHNFVSVGFLTVLAEAAAQAQDAGIAPEDLVAVLQAGGGAGVALDRMVPFLTRGDRHAMPFSIANAAKDLDYYVRMSTEAGAAATAAEGIRQALARAAADGGAEATLPELAELLRDHADASAGTGVT